MYKIQDGTGRLQQESYPNGSYVEYTYYDADTPSQVGFVWKVEHKRSADEGLLIGYEYSYDLLGRVVQSVERRPDNPGTDTTVYAYTPAGRLESEVRKGQVWYSRYYAYNLDGSRHTVERDDMLNGEHVDVYAYDPVSGRLASVQDKLTGEVNSFVWNPEGTLARWEQSNSYARVFGYDEEGRLVKIERDYGSGGVQVAYEYGYNSDGARVWKRDVLNGQEYRYVCRIGCGGVPMRVYNRAMSGGRWNTLEEYMDAPTVRWYGTSAESFSDYPLLAGHWLSECASPPEGTMLYQDAFGLRVGGDFGTAAVVKRVPEYLEENREIPHAFIAIANQDDLWDPIRRLACERACRQFGFRPGTPEFDACVAVCMALSKPKPKPKPKPEPTPSPQLGPQPPSEPFQCPPGLCMFVCPGKPPGCGYPGTTIECPDGVKIPLPPDCDKKPPNVPKDPANTLIN